MNTAPRINVFASGPHHGARALHIPQNPHNSSTTSASPMAIPNAREKPPPPLPPPRHVGSNQGEDIGWKYGNPSPASSATVKPGSSLLGNQSFGAQKYYDSRRGSTLSNSTDMMEGLEHSYDERPSLSGFKFQSERELGKKEVHTTQLAYDKQLLSRIGGPAVKNNKLAGQSGLKPLSVPDHRYPSMDSPLSRWQSAPPSAVSPGVGFRSPFFEHTSIDSTFPSRVNSISTPDGFDDSASEYRSHRNSDDQGVFLDPELTKMDGLDMQDRTSSGGDGEQLGIKRRASSPPSENGPAREDRVSGSGNDLYHRRSMQMLATKNSPIARTNQYGTSLSSTASLGPKQGSSFTSTWNMSNASSLTSYSGERLSPGALSPQSADQADFGALSPHAVSQNYNRSPRSSLSKPAPHHLQLQPTQSTMPSPPRENYIKEVITARTQKSRPIPWEGYPHVCDCCPKKPKKFDSAEELRIHEAEKQYQCAYCSNRFKNKNEAERHQNSLHLRKFSWSCAALNGVAAAFHPSQIHPTTSDICGYCGDAFPNPANWEVRAEHLCQQHKFGECNQAKKFYRADHFRQHLKHSHAGTSGKWTNMLETSCQQDEKTPAVLAPRHLGLSGGMAGSSGQSMAPSVGYVGPFPDIIEHGDEN